MKLHSTTMITRFNLCAGFLAAALLVGCASNQPTSAIRKVQPFHLKEIQAGPGQDRMIRSESQKRLWGAVTNTERRERMGNYFMTYWGVDEASPATVRFEYRQARTGSKLFKQEVQVAAPGRRNVTEFSVLGENYEKQGRVVAWRIQVIQGDQVVGEETSFLWN